MPTLRPAHIYVADDDRELRSMLGSALRRDGHVVTELPDAWELNRRMAHVGGDDAPDLVLTDVKMPGPSIFATLDQPWACTSEAPSLVIMSAFSDTAVHRRARELGAAMFDKPFDLDDLRTCVGHMVGRSARWRPRRATSAPKRVLLAEDDPALRELVAGELRSIGCVVDEAKNGLELCAAIGDKDNYDLVVTDVRMPGITGMSVLRGMRAGDSMRTAGLPVLVMTSFADEDLRIEARRLGALVLDKPFDMTELRMWTRLLLDVSADG